MDMKKGYTRTVSTRKKIRTHVHHARHHMNTWILISRERCHQRKRYWNTRPDMKSGTKKNRDRSRTDISHLSILASSHHTAFCMQYAGRHEHSTTVTLNSYDSRYIQYNSTRMSIRTTEYETAQSSYAALLLPQQHRCACLSLSLAYCQMIDTHS